MECPRFEPDFPKPELNNKGSGQGGAVAECSKALLVRENTRKPKDPRVAPPPPARDILFLKSLWTTTEDLLILSKYLLNYHRLWRENSFTKTSRTMGVWTDASHPAAKTFRGRIIDVAEATQWRWLEESGQWHENVDPTHLVLASGKPVLQKNTVKPWSWRTRRIWPPRGSCPTRPSWPSRSFPDFPKWRRWRCWRQRSALSVGARWWNTYERSLSGSEAFCSLVAS